MRVLNDFACSECAHQEELYAEIGHYPACSVCGGPTVKVLSAPSIHLESISGDFPSTTARWAKDHERRAKMALRKIT